MKSRIALTGKLLIFNTRITIKNAFYIAYTLLFIGNIVCNFSNLSDFIPAVLIKLLSASCIICFCFLIFLILTSQKYSNYELVFVVGILAVFGMSFIICRTNRVLVGVLLILCSKNLDMDKLCRYSMKMIALTVITISFLAVSGLIGMSVQVRGFDSEVTRYAMGFNHPNTVGILTFQWICCYAYLKRDDLTLKKFIPPLIIAVIVYKITNSVTSLLMTFVLIFTSSIFIIIKHHHKMHKHTTKRMATLFVVTTISIATSTIYYIWNNPYVLKGKYSTLRARFTVSQNFLDAYGIQPFGSMLEIGKLVHFPGTIGVGYGFLDNGYVRLMVESGLFVTIICLVTMVLYIRTLIKTDDWQMLIITICLLIYFFNESKMSVVYFNLFLINIGVKLYGSLEENKISHKLKRFYGNSKLFR